MSSFRSSSPAVRFSKTDSPQGPTLGSFSCCTFFLETLTYFHGFLYHLPASNSSTDSSYELTFLLRFRNNNSNCHLCTTSPSEPAFQTCVFHAYVFIHIVFAPQTCCSKIKLPLTLLLARNMKRNFLHDLWRCHEGCPVESGPPRDFYIGISKPELLN